MGWGTTVGGLLNSIAHYDQINEAIFWILWAIFWTLGSILLLLVDKLE